MRKVIRDVEKLILITYQGNAIINVNVEIISDAHNGYYTYHD